MAKRIKIFSTYDNPINLENEINRWLDRNKDANILELTATGSGDGQLGFSFTVAMLVEGLRKIEEQEEPVKRHHERRDLFNIVDYAVEGKYYRDFIQDMSESGLLIRTSNTFSAGQEILITFMAPNLERPVKLNGTIARTLPEGIGVKFKKESQLQEDLIRSLIENL